MVEVESSDLVVDSGTDKGSPSAGTEAAAGRRAARPALWDLERPGRGLHQRRDVALTLMIIAGWVHLVSVHVIG